MDSSTVSIFITWKDDEVIHESNLYKFIIPRNVVLEFGEIEYAISRTVFDVPGNKVYYLLRKVGDNKL